jgi:hypothetical protein
MRSKLLLGLSSLLCVAFNQTHAMMRSGQRAGLNDASLSAFLQRLPPEVAKRVVKPFFIQRSTETGTIIIDHRLTPAILPARIIDAVRESASQFNKDRGDQFAYSLQQVTQDPQLHSQGCIKRLYTKSESPFNMLEATDCIRRDPLSFVSFGSRQGITGRYRSEREVKIIRDVIETHVHISYFEKLEKLNLDQINFIIDLYGYEQANINLNNEQFDIFNSLPHEIQSNLLKNYSIARPPKQIIRLNHAALLPAICSVPCRAELTAAINEVRGIIVNENPNCIPGNKLPIVYKCCSWNDRSKRFVLGEACYAVDEAYLLSDDKELINKHMRGEILSDAERKKYESLHQKRRLKIIDLSVAGGRGRETAPHLHAELESAHRALSNRKSFIVCGLADGSINVSFDKSAFDELEKLAKDQSVDLLELIIYLFNNPAASGQLNEPRMRAFETLPQHMQDNLRKNYNIAAAPRTVVPPVIESRKQKLARLYKRYNNHKLVYITKLAISAGILYYSLKWLSASKMLQHRNGTLNDVLQHKKKFIAGTAMLLGATQKLGPLATSYMYKKLFARA